ncbi:Rieske 2Fe-2S domain-containing protein [Methylomonas sp. LL1]|uniref:Rieske (2Fe-2S) protein n=1 Tax=Methylomonas sp. LL1 TaxID=2785785 RepID=UPI0018C38CE9|nr:Rieske 2Fe-2S domain-containing protein [Methylomonas sp. LL1]QPK64774.1 Rieske 2Fe-2S domain-containing protein [Methylomonas sp. LL1]
MPRIDGHALTEQNYLSVDVLLNSTSVRATSANLLLFRYRGQVHAYVNHCMHMHKALNCQQDAIFDAERRWLRCSMHGFIFDPETGVCLSPVCQGRSLKAIKVVERDGLVVFTEKHLQVLAVHRHLPLAGEEGA